MPITVAAGSKSWTVFARLNAGIVGSNPSQGMDVCLRLFCVCVVLHRYWPCVGLIPRPRSPTDCLRLRNWSETKRLWEQHEINNNLSSFFKIISLYSSILHDMNLLTHLKFYLTPFLITIVCSNAFLSRKTALLLAYRIFLEKIVNFCIYH
jgi:hypothetical protein